MAKKSAASLAKRILQIRKRKNEAERELRKLQDELTKELAESGKPCEFSEGGKRHVAAIEPAQKREVNLAKLKKLLSSADFMKCVKATQRDVEAVAGKVTLNRCVETIQGPPRLVIRENT